MTSPKKKKGTLTNIKYKNQTADKIRSHKKVSPKKEESKHCFSIFAAKSHSILWSLQSFFMGVKNYWPKM